MRVKTLKRIRYNGKTFEKDDELEFLEDDEAREYIESGIFIKSGSKKVVEEKSEEVVQESGNITVEEMLEESPIPIKVNKKVREKKNESQ